VRLINHTYKVSSVLLPFFTTAREQQQQQQQEKEKEKEKPADGCGWDNALSLLCHQSEEHLRSG
jgi:hypothetical protein